MSKVQIHKHPDHPEDMGARMAKRLRPSNDPATADVLKSFGSSPQRVNHSVHFSGNQKQQGSSDKGER